MDITYAITTSSGFAQDGICFAARSSGLYRSDDGGRTWQFAYKSLESSAPLVTMAVVLSPDFVSDGNVFASVPGGILRSFDGGQNWDAVHLPSPPPVVVAFAISPNYVQDGILLAGTMEDGVFSTTDRGGHWAAWNFGLLDLNALCVDISADYVRDETLFLGVGSGIFRSTNGGRAWREVGFSVDLAPVLSIALSPRYSEDGILFVGTEADGLFRSDDRGRTWTRIGSNIIVDAVNDILLSPDFPERPDVLVVQPDGLHISRDGGLSWAQWTVDVAPENGLTCVAAPLGLDASAPLLIGLMDGGVLRI